MKILITGGAGYIGAELVYLLAEKSAVSEIVIYDNFSRKNYNLLIFNPIRTSNKIRLVNHDILDSRAFRKELKGTDVLVHLAAKVSTPFSNEDPHAFEQINHWGAAEISYALEESDVKKVIYLSSTSVYGSSDELIFDENSACNPDTFYGQSKLKAEKHLRRLSDRMKTYIVRCGNIYGFSPCMRFDSVINRFMLSANFDRSISIHGTGKQKRSFVNIKKVVNRMWQLIESDIPSDTYNLVNFNKSVLEIAGLVKEIYPDLEFIFVDQHAKMRNLEVNPNTRFLEYFPMTYTDLKEELKFFDSKFAYH